MQPYSTGVVYVNYLGRDADEGAEWIKPAQVNQNIKADSLTCRPAMALWKN